MPSKNTYFYDSKGNLYIKNKKREEEENESSEEEKEEKVAKSKKDSKKSTSREQNKRKNERSPSPSESEEGSDDEITSVEEMKDKKKKEESKRYRQCKKFVKDYERELKKSEEVPEWKQADELFTQAASIGARLHGLTKSSLKGDSHLLKAIPKLRATGEKKFEQAQKIISKLSPEDAEKFWAIQVRNKNSKTFDELVTKTKHKEDMIEETIKTRIKTALKERGIVEDEVQKQQQQEKVVENDESVKENSNNNNNSENTSNIEVNTKDGQQETVHIMEMGSEKN